jgi:two-component system OmpR family response regulator
VRILIADPDAAYADDLLRDMRKVGAIVDRVVTGSEVNTALMTCSGFDLLILDLNLPRMHGLEVLKRLRARGSRLHVLILTAADSVEERVKALDAGADDYMTKPYSLDELQSRVRTLWRRSLGGSSNQIRFGPMTYDLANRMVLIDDKRVDLTARELRVLEVLLQRANSLVTKDQLVDRLCRWGEEVSDNAVEVYIHRLRKKIEKPPIRIVAVRGLGYCLKSAVE